MKLHHETRSKRLVDHLARLNLSITYEKVLRLETEIANKVHEKVTANNGIYIPSKINPELPVYFAIDNVDFRTDSKNGKGDFHGTATVAYQPKQELEEVVQVERKGYGRSYKKLSVYTVKTCAEPTRKNEIYSCFLNSTDISDLKLYGNWDNCWALLHTLIPNREMIPTWAAFNSLLTESSDKTVHYALPLLRTSPTDWSTLYTALCAAQGINTIITPGRKTLISLDMQLYIKAIKLKAKDTISRNYIFRIGELHTIFAFLKSMGKYINMSGLDQTFVESDIYGPNTIEKIKDGKHMKKGIEGFTILCLTLYKSYMEKFLTTDDSLREEKNDVIQIYRRDGDLIFDEIKEKLAVAKENLYTVFNQSGFVEKLQEFDDTLGKQATFYRNYMEMFECLLLCLRSTKQRCWELHLSSLHELAKYFFVHDQQNYARMVPVYLAEMYALKEEEPEVWQFLA